MQLALFDRPTPSDTRTEARQRIVLSVHHLQARVLRYLVERGSEGGTDEQIAAGLRMKSDTARARRVELRDMKLVLDSGRRRPTRSGRAAIVWTASTAAQLPAAASIDVGSLPVGSRHCDHSLGFPGGSWVTRVHDGERIVECSACGRYYGHIRADISDEIHSYPARADRAAWLPVPVGSTC